MAGRPPPPKIIVVHGRQVVVDKRIGMNQLNGGGGRERMLHLPACGLRSGQDQNRPQSFAAREDTISDRFVDLLRVVACLGQISSQRLIDLKPPLLQVSRQRLRRHGHPLIIPPQPPPPRRGAPQARPKQSPRFAPGYSPAAPPRSIAANRAWSIESLPRRSRGPPREGGPLAQGGTRSPRAASAPPRIGLPPSPLSPPLSTPRVNPLPLITIMPVQETSEARRWHRGRTHCAGTRRTFLVRRPGPGARPGISDRECPGGQQRR